jgi:tetratricopeptide (TPR) repeat protein
MSSPIIAISSRICAVILTAALCLIGCSRKDNSQNSPEAKTAVPARKGYAAIEEVPAEIQAQAEMFARNLEQDIRGHKLRGLRAAFDPDAIADGICEQIQSKGDKLEKFKEGLSRGLATGVGQVAEIWSKGEAKYKRLVIYHGDVAARFRFLDEQSGIAMLDLVLRTNRQGKLAIANFCNHAMGYDMVEQSRQLAAPMLAELDKTFLERLVNQPDVTPEDMKKFSALTQNLRSGNFSAVISGYKTLPPSLRDTMAATSLYISALQQSGDNDAYKTALKQAGVRFKAANFQFMLVDVYALDKQFDKAEQCVDAFMKAVEKDAALLTLKSLMQNARGDVSGARATLGEAFKMEPDCVYAHSKGLDVLLASKDYPAVRDSLVFLEKNGYDFKGQLRGEPWAGFRAAAESAPWR